MKAWQSDITKDSKRTRGFLFEESKKYRDKLRNVLGFKNMIKPVVFRKFAGLEDKR